jgi:hypothetical protein
VTYVRGGRGPDPPPSGSAAQLRLRDCEAHTRLLACLESRGPYPPAHGPDLDAVGLAVEAAAQLQLRGGGVGVLQRRERLGGVGGARDHAPRRQHEVPHLSPPAERKV